MKLTDEQRNKVKRYIFDSCMSCMFGDGLEADYIRDGFPAFKGIDHMTDDELLEEAGMNETESLEELLKRIEFGEDVDEDEDNEDVPY